ncbi:hypothetical protein PTTG_29978 [Puccinia triticina 1-1 BBBD Race 1]|uniref:Uncharacterized protein n=1 Tax=Puccinia triticina (isolate 1-1 / race 1 (BBBD)) TaxID=630390 RepID=A0A180G1H1_PUCT1|nr:hypothetical protein PTTG_29978 [Puccinia triticina 1-1 BBBD Race 1]
MSHHNFTSVINTSDQGMIPMDTTSESTHLPSKERIINQLQLIQYSLSILQERLEGATEPIGSILLEMEDDLGNVKEKLFAAVTSIKPITPASKFTDPITNMAKYFPIMLELEKKSDINTHSVQVLKRLNFEERALMSSVSIERNEMYEDVYLKLREMESETVQEVIDMGRSPVHNATAFHQYVEDEIRRKCQFEEFQTKLLQLRIKRYRIEEVVKELTEQSDTANQTSPTLGVSSVVYRAASGNEGGAPESHQSASG